MTGSKVTSNINLSWPCWIKHLKLSFRQKKIFLSYWWCSQGTFQEEWTEQTKGFSKTRQVQRNFCSRYENGQSSRRTQNFCGTTYQQIKRQSWPNWWTPHDLRGPLCWLMYKRLISEPFIPQWTQSTNQIKRMKMKVLLINQVFFIGESNYFHCWALNICI